MITLKILNPVWPWTDIPARRHVLAGKRDRWQFEISFAIPQDPSLGLVERHASDGELSKLPELFECAEHRIEIDAVAVGSCACDVVPFDIHGEVKESDSGQVRLGVLRRRFGDFGRNVLVRVWNTSTHFHPGTSP
jgi:hypothetical protein